MGPNGIFNQTITLLERSLDLRVSKHNTIVSNVANIDTPNYKAFDVMVEDELQKLSKSTHKGGRRLKTTQAGHMEVGSGAIGRPTRRLETGAEVHLKRRDGNTVDLDREMAAMAENSLMYTLSAQVVAKKFQALRNIIQGGNK